MSDGVYSTIDSASSYAQQDAGDGVKDVIGGTNTYSISKAVFDQSSTDFVARIYTTYAGENNPSGTSYGSLFLGAGTIAPGDDWTFQDIVNNGSGTFTHAVYLPGTIASNASGVGTDVYSINTGGGTSDTNYNDSGDVVLSNANNNLIYRQGQAVTINTSSATDVGDAKYTISDNSYIEIVISGFYGTGGLAETQNLVSNDGFMIFGWAMSCANDVILGTVAVPGLTTTIIPLPSGILLLLSGLLGIGFLGRYRGNRVPSNS